jgi:hypothetical protein
MLTPKACNAPSRKESCHQTVKDFFSQNGHPEEIDEMLWSILMAAMSSKDFDDMSGMERANMLHLYRSLVKLLAEVHESHLNLQDK